MKIDVAITKYWLIRVPGAFFDTGRGDVLSRIVDIDIRNVPKFTISQEFLVMQNRHVILNEQSSTTCSSW